MIDKNKFRGKVVSEGLTMGNVAEMLNINPTTLHRKLSGESEFTRKEIQQLRGILNLSAEDVDLIFFSEELA